MMFEDSFKWETLFPYQREGVKIILNTNTGHLLADQVGLGKTPQALAVAEKIPERAMIICPASLRQQWGSEIRKFTDSTYTIIEGTKGQRKKLWEVAEETKYTVLGYDTLRSADDRESAIKLSKGAFLVLDEISKVKNFRAKRTKGLKALKPGKILGLTGTPIENNLEEFYQVFSIINPHRLGPFYLFAKRFLIRRLMRANGQTFWVNEGEKNVNVLKMVIEGYFLRRTRDEVLDLPPTSTVVREVSLGSAQKRIEKQLREEAKKDPNMVLPNFTFALENLICPAILPQEKISPTVREMVAKEMKVTPRIQEVLNILEETKPHKVIVFSKFKKALKEIASHVSENISWVTGDSDIPSELAKWDRILLMSPAGSYGLNLQEAHFMIILDKPFNPAVLEQVKGRIDRVGQASNVVYFEIKSDSQIEQRVERIIGKKEKLSKDMLAKKVMA